MVIGDGNVIKKVARNAGEIVQKTVKYTHNCFSVCANCL